jgi:hypothetical protein
VKVNIDNTFCNFYNLCSEKDTCDKKLTEEVEDEARKLGISVSRYIKVPKCFNSTIRGVMK